ncbi:MAG: multidrug ABC transporter ATP-binding protein [Rhodospirillaceae bacterium]|jgi:ABC-2 type transport system ATP-binding protein|nr:multidrug ABC transporter ATP-binding protein [Rhodospirillaceae bacterium]
MNIEKSHRNDDMPLLAVDIQNLTKIYNPSKGKTVEALNNINMKVPQGSIFGILGPNGAGKSTLINILAGLVVKTSGIAKIWNFDIERETRRARAAIGVVPQEVSLDAFFSPREALELQAGLYGVPKKERRTDEILEAIGLTEKANADARSLSGGMKRRLLIGKALVHAPPVVVLDEPTAGVDVELRRQLWDYVRDLNKAGTTILLTTHYLKEAEKMCDTIAIIDQGQMVACDATPALIERLDQRTLIITIKEKLHKLPDNLNDFSVTLTTPIKLTFEFSPSKTSTGEIITAVQKQMLTIVDLQTLDSDLEDVFIRLTNLNG